ncbi:MAG: hypothetical protein PHE44_11990, partial [Proteiniphilum sp.]|nr:hypothetical protein [Proteiniphilum sp.]
LRFIFAIPPLPLRYPSVTPPFVYKEIPNQYKSWSQVVPVIFAKIKISIFTVPNIGEIPELIFYDNFAG